MNISSAVCAGILIAALQSGVSAQDPTAEVSTRLTLRGKVVTASGAPVPGAKVTIATAAVRKGISPY